MDYKAMLESLWLTDQPLWDFALYGLFLLNIILLIVVPSESSFGTMLGIVILISIVIDKTYAFGYLMKSPYPKDCHAKIFIGTYLIRAIMFVAPLTIAGSTESGKARGMGILAGLAGGAYMFGRWFMEQRDVVSTTITCQNPEAVAASAQALLLLGYVAARRSVRLVNGHVPLPIARELAAHEVEV